VSDCRGREELRSVSRRCVAGLAGHVRRAERSLVLVVALLVLVVALPTGHVDHAEQAILLVIDARGEEEGVPTGAAAAVAELDPPQSLVVGAVEATVEDQRLAMGVLKLAEEVAVLEFEGVYVTIAEVADQQGLAEPAEVVRSDRHAPGRIE